MRVSFVVMLSDRREVGPGSAPRYSEIRARALAAEANGWDGIWLYDHLLYRDDESTLGIWGCWTMLAALAEATTTVGIGALVVCTQFRNPTLLAKMAATLDEVSGGRFTLGLGAGWNRPEFDAFGFPWDHRVSRFEEAIEIIAPLLRDGKVDFDGAFYQARNCVITPRGPSPQGPKILVGSTGQRMLGLAARHADMWNSGDVSAPNEFEDRRGLLKKACEDAERDPATIAATAELVVWYPDLSDEPPRVERYVDASSSDLAELLAGFDEAAADEVMIRTAPATTDGFLRASSALHQYRQRA